MRWNIAYNVRDRDPREETTDETATDTVIETVESVADRDHPTTGNPVATTKETPTLPAVTTELESAKRGTVEVEERSENGIEIVASAEETTRDLHDGIAIFSMIAEAVVGVVVEMIALVKKTGTSSQSKLVEALLRQRRESLRQTLQTSQTSLREGDD